jgi:GH15 family glucan-1,4-alpha-glucosidase
MYGVDERAEPAEETLDHLDGHRGSRPVRIGNGEYRQLQLDIYGELMDAVYLHNKYVEPVGYDGWMRLRSLVDWVCDNWGREDEAIWEVRGGRRHFFHSKLMSWVALDRGLRLADKRSFPADRARWLKVRDEIYEEVMARGWDPAHARVRPGLRLGRAGRVELAPWRGIARFGPRTLKQICPKWRDLPISASARTVRSTPQRARTSKAESGRTYSEDRCAVCLQI